MLCRFYSQNNNMNNDNKNNIPCSKKSDKKNIASYQYICKTKEQNVNNCNDRKCSCPAECSEKNIEQQKSDKDSGENPKQNELKKLDMLYKTLECVKIVYEFIKDIIKRFNE